MIGDMISEGIVRMKCCFRLNKYTHLTAYVDPGAGDALVPREMDIDIEAGQSYICLAGRRGAG
jgi:hypothetical protein